MSRNKLFDYLFKAFNISAIYLLFIFIFSGKVLGENISESQTSGTSILFNEIEISGNTIYSDSELLNVITPLSKGKITIDRLIQARKEITDFYNEQGYIATGAFIPHQKLDSGTIKIVVIEGKLSEIAFENDNIINKKYILKRLPSNDKVLNISSLQSSLSNLQNSQFIEKIRGEITFTEVGKIKLILDIEENPRLLKQFNVSNTFSSSIGEFGGQANFRFNTLGFGDVLELGTTKTEGLSQFFVSYSIPLNRYDSRFTYIYNNASSRPILDELEAVDINGEFASNYFELSQPIFFNNSQKLDIKIGFNLNRGESFILEDFSFSFIEGLDSGVNRTSELSFIQQYTNKGINQSFVLSSIFNVGVDIFDPTIVANGRDGLYWNWEFQSQGIIKLNSSINWISDLKLQLSQDNLLPGNQFSLGGASSVRGYNRNLFLGNNGISVSNELQKSIYKSTNSEVKVIAFLDGGRVWNGGSGLENNQNLFSSGLGLQYLQNNFLNIRFDYAIPLTNIEEMNSESSTTDFTFTVQVFQ